MIRAVYDTLRVGLQFSHIKNMVSVFGSARTAVDSKDYELAYVVGLRLARLGYNVMTGGGPGIMEAANKGAFSANKSIGGTLGKSYGIGIELPFEQVHNEYVHGFYLASDFNARKSGYIIPAKAFIIFPGGYGTMDELFEVLTLLQTKKKPKVPVILMNSKFWKPWITLTKRCMLDQFKTISPEDINLMTVCDTVEDVLEHI